MALKRLASYARTRTFKMVLPFAAAYALGGVYFSLVVAPDATKVPGDPRNFLRDAAWVIYWRFSLDAVIVVTFSAVVILETWAFVRASRARPRWRSALSTYVSPLVTTGAAFVYMVAIDVGVTYFADLGFNGTWESTRVLWLGFNARELYHDFFFWYVPLALVCGITNQVAVHSAAMRPPLKTYCVLMAGYSLNLGFLDPAVCQILWGDWRVFGEWAMGGADAMFAEGWVAHYVAFAVAWLFGAIVVERVGEEAARSASNAEENVNGSKKSGGTRESQAQAGT